MKIKIGVTSGWEPGTIVEGWPLVYVNKDITDHLAKAGAIPFIIPISENEALTESYLEMADGLVVAGEVLSIKRNVFIDGGNNVLYNSNPLRYKNESVIIKKALEMNIPILGICRGYQVLNVEEGGTMKEEDITIGNKIIHQQGGIASPEQSIHEISIKKGTKLFKMLNKTKIKVNSFHRQALKSIPSGYVVSAFAQDGNIEAIETEDERLVIGTQFHPEMLKDGIWHEFFKSYIKAVKHYKTTNLNNEY